MKKNGFPTNGTWPQTSKDETLLSSLRRDFTDTEIWINKTKLLNYFRRWRVTLWFNQRTRQKVVLVEMTRKSHRRHVRRGTFDYKSSSLFQHDWREQKETLYSSRYINIFAIDGDIILHHQDESLKKIPDDTRKKKLHSQTLSTRHSKTLAIIKGSGGLTERHLATLL